MKNICYIKPISKFFLPDYMSLRTSSDEAFFDFGNLFWQELLSKKYLEKFYTEKYTEFVSLQYPQENHIVQDYVFLLDKIDAVSSKIFSREVKTPPTAEDIFFFYRSISYFCHCYSDFFSKDGITIDLREGIICRDFPTDFSQIDLYIKNFLSSTFYQQVFSSLFSQEIHKYSNFKVYKISIFWPSEIFQACIISYLIKKTYPDSKVILDFSQANEQFDFTQWIEIIFQNQKEFFKYFDFGIVFRDFGKTIFKLEKHFNGEASLENIENLIYLKNQEVCFENIKNSPLQDEDVLYFFKENFSPVNEYSILGDVSVFGRMLPYKCYWNQCNFCTINTNNTFEFHPRYGFDFFIDTWIEYIEKHSINSITFKDEAIPPKALIAFAKKVLERGIKVHFQFRTRMELAFTKDVCKLLAQAGARYCGMGLESAIDRVNVELGNKGDENVNLKHKVQILQNFDSAGIPVHNYSIMGFAGESPLEMSITYQFLVSQIQKLQYFTCTPNIFSLMKGSKMLENKEKYHIEVEQKYLENPFLLSYPFSCNGIAQDVSTLKKYAEDIHRQQFTPWFESGYAGNVQITEYWNFLDRSYIFYLMKKFCFPSPYRADFYNNLAQNISLETLKNLYFKISEYIQKYSTDEKFLYDWVCDTEYHFSQTSLFEFISLYNSEKNLAENLHLFPHIHESDVVFLIKNRVLLVKNIEGMKKYIHKDFL